MEKVNKYFSASPGLFGYVIIVLGIMLITGAVRDWNWLLEGGDGKVFNITWFIDTFGRKAARVMYGITGGVCILIGIAWIYIYARLSSIEQ